MMNGYNFDALSNTLTISASFAKKASKVGTLEYNIINQLRRDYPSLTIQKEEKKAGIKVLNYRTMEEFISLHRNAEDLKKQFERVKKLSHIQPMPYRFVKDWFEKSFPYYSNPALDADGFVVDPVTLSNMKNMIQEVTAANNALNSPSEAAEANPAA